MTKTSFRTLSFFTETNRSVLLTKWIVGRLKSVEFSRQIFVRSLFPLPDDKKRQVVFRFPAVEKHNVSLGHIRTVL